ncbi:hypothetical protein E2562_000886 [Oryza meyeriana var. granulata]|uniref:Uncharacterized protein n=1 Tax=Oryza meyeriana var. granulata TaxID=110450 RepID=A0A6G1CY79_9ORYZ|nr:hypothetical protein E2562_000886 [Oryza meyeriana var. granulata]
MLARCLAAAHPPSLPLLSRRHRRSPCAEVAEAAARPLLSTWQIRGGQRRRCWRMPLARGWGCGRGVRCTGVEAMVLTRTAEVRHWRTLPARDNC